MYKIIDCEQRSDEWFKEKLGIISASSADKVLTPAGKLSSQAQAVVDQKISEIMTGKMPETFSNAAMERGVALEGEAREFVKLMTDIDFKEVGFLKGDGIGISPDGICFEEKIGLEIKVPLPHTHVNYLRAGVLPPKYKPQVMMSMLVTGFDKWIFCSYNEDMQSLLITVERDHNYCIVLEAALDRLVCQIKSEAEELKGDEDGKSIN